MINIKLIRLSTGEDVISNIVEESDTYIKVKNPIVAFPSEVGRIGFAPWSPLMSKEVQEIEVSKKFIIYITDPDEGIVEQYNQMFGSKLVTPSNKKLIV
jgi:hypothetical protein